MTTIRDEDDRDENSAEAGEDPIQDEAEDLDENDQLEMLIQEDITQKILEGKEKLEPGAALVGVVTLKQLSQDLAETCESTTVSTTLEHPTTGIAEVKEPVTVTFLKRLVASKQQKQICLMI